MSITRASRLRRSAHFVPGANEKMLRKSLDTEADCLILDLEDAVTPDRKGEARTVVAGWLKDVSFGRQERVVRMNPLDTPWGMDDLRETMVDPPDAYLVPKVSTLDELQVIDGVLSALEAEYGHPDGGVQMILVSTETPLGVLNLTTFSQCRRVVSLSWGAEDLSAAIGGRRNRDENGQFLDLYKYCRIQTLLCAKAAGIQALDTVFVDILDLEGLRQESLEAAWVGYTGKITIHPAQIPVVNEVFTPSEAEIAEATELLEAFDDAQARGLMAFQFKGQMVDVPHLSRARKILESAKAVRGL